MAIREEKEIKRIQIGKEDLQMPLFAGEPRFLHLPTLSSVRSLSRFRLFAIPWISARQASLSITNTWSLPKLMSIEWVMPSSHLMLCHSLLLLPPIPRSIRVFSNESTLHIRCPKEFLCKYFNIEGGRKNITRSQSWPGEIQPGRRLHLEKDP